jgi:hypothetical protein
MQHLNTPLKIRGQKYERVEGTHTQLSGNLTGSGRSPTFNLITERECERLEEVAQGGGPLYNLLT